jgi:hypothetical protein
MFGVIPAFELKRLGCGRIFAVRGGRVGVAAVGAHQSVNHELEWAGCLVPVHGRQNDDAMRSSPALINFSHPVAGLSLRMVGVATARPVAQRHGG